MLHDNLKGIYAITDDILTPRETILEKVSEALLGGVNIIQLRDKKSEDSDLLEICIEIRSLCRAHDAIFIINDRVELTKKVRADGVHVGFHNLSVPETRAFLRNDYIIGASCYGDIDRAIKAEKDGADYAAFGAFFPSPTKPKADVISMDIIKQAKEQLNIPICVIGGINKDNIKELKPYQPDMYAVVSAIFKGDNVFENTIELNNLINK